jgi:AraC-like DNA-binding protein/quercetin dioxygenase-like cupin family protein
METASKADFELVPRSELSSFAVREFKLPAFASPWHYHPECELTCILQSSGRRFVGDSIARFGPGELVLLGANLPHYWRNDAPAQTASTYAHSLVIQFREECFGAEFLSLPELAGVRKLLLRARRGLLITGATSREVKTKMLQLKNEKSLGSVVGLLNILHTLCQSDEHQTLSSHGFTALVDEFAGERINKAYQYVFQHFTGAFDHQEIARMVGMSLSAFCHYFKRVTGRPLSDFIKEVRIGHARKLLMETDATVAEIAYASGFDSLSNFNRQFRQLSKISPKGFRKEQQRC